MSHAKNTEPHLESSVCGFLREPLAFWQFHRAAGTAEASRVELIRDIERLSFATRDGRKLGGYKLRAENPQGYLLVAQGNAMLAGQIMGVLAHGFLIKKQQGTVVQSLPPKLWQKSPANE